MERLEIRLGNLTSKNISATDKMDTQRFFHGGMISRRANGDNVRENDDIIEGVSQ